MVAEHPTTSMDLWRVRQHDWSPARDGRSQCTDCGLTFAVTDWLADMPACPGPNFLLNRRPEPSLALGSRCFEVPGVHADDCTARKAES
jgi:hypothetical protein